MSERRPALPPPALECLRAAGRIASAVRDSGAGMIRPGASLREVCEAVEEEIRKRGGEAAFPAQTSRNQVAAHYCPGPQDDSVYEDGDVAKLDIGVHVDGWVVDTALTVNVGDRPENRPLIDAARAALDAAIALLRPDTAVRTLSSRIEQTIRSFGLQPVKNLCGHGVGRWTVHCPPPIPNVADSASDRLPAGAVVAIEPFATTGRGLVSERGAAEVFRLDPGRDAGRTGDRDVVATIRALRGLPFARRQLAGLPREAVESTLRALSRSGVLMSYPPLVETTGRPVAQAEHTVYLGARGVEVLTR
ncbi:MAG TPA: type II methionyl aminopeptidase [Vicinamibacteria bacterium]|nr:type II methionyl aminopeptidase [Vicinamibacteria bacterium]